MKIIEKTVLRDGTVLQHEDWSEDYPTIHQYSDQLAAYPIAKQTIPHYDQDGKFIYDYPKRGERFRLGIHFDSTAEAEHAFADLRAGLTSLDDYAENFDSTGNTRKEDFFCALFAPKY